LFDDVSHFFLLLLLLIDLFLQSLDLLGELIKPVPVKRSVSDRADECCIGILERLGEDQLLYGSHYENAHSVLLFPGQLARGLEIDTQIGVFPFLVLVGVLNGIDVERHRETLDG
jgi:hypothetical protein